MQGIDRYEPTLMVSTIWHNDAVAFVIKDNGNSIMQKDLKKFYQPFYTTKPTGEGTGLGLSHCYDINTKGHGGDILVTTQEGEGAEFTICLKV